MKVGLIGGTVFYGSDLFKQAEYLTIDTEFGPALVLITDKVAYIPRHGIDKDKYVLPHEINHQANALALKELGVKDVIGINSAGSLKPSLNPGKILVIKDYISPWKIDTILKNKSLHITPVISLKIRNDLLAAAKKAGIEVTHWGYYLQTIGPRLETKVEVEMMRAFADVIGMTLASEATCCQEAGLEYASLCSIVNYCNGIISEPLSEEMIRKGAKANADKMKQIFEAYLNDYSEND